jgi:undecaprenyl-phosphate 4-deoxy-4-formamido-L-arabinose transferase
VAGVSGSVSVLVPVLNGEQTIGELVTRMRSVLNEYGREHEIILIDDGSTDGSWEIMDELARTDSGVVAIGLSRNFGQHNALLCGIRAARMDVIVTIDDDLQLPPSEVPLLLDALQPGVDLVYGRAQHYRHGVFRRASMVVLKFLLECWFRVPFARQTTSFRAFRTSLRDSFDESPGREFSLDALLVASTRNVTSVVVRHDPSPTERSRHTLGTLMRHVTDSIAGSSFAPLFFASVVGAVTLAAGLIGAAVWLVAMVAGVDPSPWWIVASVVGVLWGLTLLALGLLGNYAARLLIRSSSRRVYAVARSTGLEDRPSG